MNLVDWTLNTIRSEETMMSWMEERRFDWVPLINDFMEKIVDGTTIVLIVDNDRLWLEKYIINFLNKESKNRPYLPIISKSDLKNENIDIVMNMLDISFKNDYIFWYIGRASGNKFKLAKKREDSFMFILDDEIQNSFFLRSKDEYLDIKLINLIRLIDKTVDGILFGDISLDG